MDSDADGVPSEFFDYFKVSALLSLSLFNCITSVFSYFVEEEFLIVNCS